MSIPAESLSLAIKQIQHHHHRAMDAALAGLGISLVQWTALREIARHPGASMHALAEMTFNSDQAFGTLAMRLIRDGLVTRVAGPGRVNRHQLTERGRMLLDQGQLLVRPVIARSFTGFSDDERAALAGLLGKIRNAQLG